MLTGVTRNEFKRWYETDPEFRDGVQSITNEMMDNLEAFGYEKAMTEKGFGYWVTLLKAYRPEKFNPQKMLAAVDGRDLDQESDRARRANLARIVAIDAEVIEATTGAPPPKIVLQPSVDDPPAVEEQVLQPPVTPKPVEAAPEYPAYSGPTDLIFKSDDKMNPKDFILPPEVRPKKQTGGSLQNIPPPPLPPPQKNKKNN